MQARKYLIVLGSGLMLAACGGNPDVAPKVSYSFNPGNGDGVQYQGPAPKISYAYGLGNGDSVQSGQKANIQYGYGAESTTGDMVQMTPAEKQQLASPAANTVPTPATTRQPGTHS